MISIRVTDNTGMSGYVGYVSPDTWCTPISTYRLKLSKDSTITIDDDFVMPIQEFRACLKVLQKLARREYPEDFI